MESTDEDWTREAADDMGSKDDVSEYKRVRLFARTGIKWNRNDSSAEISISNDGRDVWYDGPLRFSGRLSRLHRESHETIRRLVGRAGRPGAEGTNHVEELHLL